MIVHMLPMGDDGLTPCCNQSLYDLPRTDQVTLNPELVTCGQ